MTCPIITCPPRRHLTDRKAFSDARNRLLYSGSISYQLEAVFCI